jgi:predicted MFS family arabinose efflux permease
VPDHAGPRPALLVLALALGVTTLSLTQTLVVPVLGQIAEQLEVSTASAGWVLTANLLAAAVLTPVLGRLGDLRGERVVVLGILIAVSAGTVLALVATSLPLLLLARVAQAASYGLFPLSIAVLRRELRPDRLSVAMSVVSSTLAVGGVIGLVATGLLSGDGSDYRTPFWIGLAFALVTLALAWRVLPHRPPTGSGSVDWWGALVLGAGLVLLLLPISQAPSWGWGSPGVIGCFVGAAVVLTGWLVLQRRLAEPLVRPAMLTDRRTVVPNVAGVMVGIALFASFLAILQYVQTPPGPAGYGFGASVLEASVVYLLPGGILAIAASPVAGTLVGRFGPLPTLLTAGVLGCAGFLVLALLRDSSWAVVLTGVLTQLAITLAFAALPTLVNHAVQPSETGVANAVNSIARSAGQALGSALTVTLLAGSLDPATGFPRDVAYTQVSLVGAGACGVVVLVALLARRDTHGDRLRRVRHGTGPSGEPQAATFSARQSHGGPHGPTDRLLEPHSGSPFPRQPRRRG